MTGHIGIVACSAEGAALCYRTICNEAPALMGEHDHPEVTMSTVPLARYMQHIRTDDWQSVAELMLYSARVVAHAGADFAICPDNTVHQAYDLVYTRSPIPWLHIAEVVAMEAKQLDHRHLGVLGTRYLMEGPVYSEILGEHDIAFSVPDPGDRLRIDAIIFEELVNGVLRDESRSYFNEIIARLRERGCDAVVLGCTEIPLLVRADESPLPTLDSTRLLARAAVQKALSAD